MSGKRGSLIGFGRCETGGRSFRGVAAATAELREPDFISATPADVDRAAKLAADAHRTYGWTTGADRARLLRAIAEGVNKAADAITERAVLETALPEARIRSEIGRTTSQLEMFARLVEEGSWVEARIDHGAPDRKPLPKPDVRSMLRPIGPVAVFGASNFPIAFSVAGGDTASALAAGNPVIVKAHPAHPGTSELVGLAVQAAVRACGLAEGVFSLLFDSGYEVGQQLVQHPAVRAAGFTGSRTGGQALCRLAAQRPDPIPVFAEMGSINPVFILSGAARDRGAEIATGLHASFTLGVGQFCTNPGLVVLGAGDAYEPLVKRLCELVETTAPGTMLTSGMCANFERGTARLAGTHGVTLLARGGSEPARAAALVFATSAKTFLGNSKLAEEVFGPVTLIVRCDDDGEITAVAGALQGQLTATIHGTPPELESHRTLLELLAARAGRLVFNGFPTGVEVGPAMVHGGPFPATSDGQSTSVGTHAIRRFARFLAYQDYPDAALPPELQDANPLKIRRLVDGWFARR
jgi:NADP-dependent aldehyde dehydrogenase